MKIVISLQPVNPELALTSQQSDKTLGSDWPFSPAAAPCLALAQVQR